MRSGTRTGTYFGTTSGVITTLGLVVGLNAGTQSLSAVLGGVVVIAVADAMSDALGIHLSQESDPDTTDRHVWEATWSTFLAKLVTAMTFAVPLMLLPLDTAVIVSVIWGYLIISVLSYLLAVNQDQKPLGVVGEHLLIATLVIFASHWIGVWVHGFTA